MGKGIIQLCYRRLIDVHAASLWDKMIFEDSYTEFLMQAQYYNQQKKYTRFSELVQHVAGADKLHFLVSTAIVGYVKQLNGVIPGIKNNLGKEFLPFKNFRCTIIDSDIQNKAAHHIAIDFFSDSLIWLDTIGDKLLVSADTNKQIEDEFITALFSIQPMLSICSFKNLQK